MGGRLKTLSRAAGRGCACGLCLRARECEASVVRASRLPAVFQPAPSDGVSGCCGARCWSLAPPLSQYIRTGPSFLYHHRLFSEARKTLCSHHGSACCRAFAAVSSVVELTTTLVERPLTVGNMGNDVASVAPEIAHQLSQIQCQEDFRRQSRLQERHVRCAPAHRCAFHSLCRRRNRLFSPHIHACYSCTSSICSLSLKEPKSLTVGPPAIALLRRT
jgi:hypothetical protein